MNFIKSLYDTFSSLVKSGGETLGNVCFHLCLATASCVIQLWQLAVNLRQHGGFKNPFSIVIYKDGLD